MRLRQGAKIWKHFVSIPLDRVPGCPVKYLHSRRNFLKFSKPFWAQKAIMMSPPCNEKRLMLYAFLETISRPDIQTDQRTDRMTQSILRCQSQHVNATVMNIKILKYPWIYTNTILTTNIKIELFLFIHWQFQCTKKIKITHNCTKIDYHKL